MNSKIALEEKQQEENEAIDFSYFEKKFEESLNKTSEKEELVAENIRENSRKVQVEYGAERGYSFYNPIVLPSDNRENE